MKNLLITFSILSSLTIFSQEKETDNSSSKISFGVHFSPTINYRFLRSKAPTDIVKEIRDEEERSGLGFRTGFSIEYSIKKRLCIQTGVFYSNRLFQTEKTILIWSDPSLANTETFRSYQYQYIDLPLNLQYSLKKGKKINWFASIGSMMSFSNINYTRIHIKNNDSWQITREESPNLSHTIIMAEMSIGAEFKINSSMKLRSSICYQQGVSPTNRDLKTKEFLYSTGLNIGFVYTLPTNK